MHREPLGCSVLTLQHMAGRALSHMSWFGRATSQAADAQMGEFMFRSLGV